MRGNNVNRQNMLCVKLLELRRHFNTCRLCHAASKARTFDMLCEWTQSTLVDVACQWDVNITGRLTAARSGKDYIFPCPDVNAHGPAYAATAEPLIVQSVVDRLF